MWVYFAGKNGVKDLNGVILVDNLAPDITLESISIDKTKTIELGKTLTLTPIFNPSNATNKIVTWTSSDESVATVSNAGVVTPKKVGSTIITVTSQDGNKKATCTVTVTEVSSGTSGGTNTSGSSINTTKGGNTSGTSSNGSTSTNGGSSSSTTTKSISTTNSNSKSSNGVSKLPYTGIGITGAFVLIVVAGIAVITYRKYNYLKGIK